jgi:hypothetical protein
MAHADVDPLLQPSLTEHDDGRGFRLPWDPSTLGWLALLVGPFGAGLLMWRNQSRLGLRGGAHLAWIMAAVGAAVIAAGVFLAPPAAKPSASTPPAATAAAEAPGAPTASGEEPAAVGLGAGTPKSAAKSAAEARNDTRRLIRFAGNAVALPLAWWLLTAQRRRFRLAQQCDAEVGILWLPGLIAFAVNVGVSFLVAAAWVALRQA